MKKWIIAAAAAGVLFLQPFDPADAGQLYVVETLALERRGGEIIVAAEALSGQGDSVDAALRDMEERTPGLLFLRQVKRIILCGDTGAEALGRLPEGIPMGATVYTSQGSAENVAQQETLQEILEARELREQNLPRLAEILNRQLEQARMEGR